MLGQNFSKMFKISFENQEHKKDLAWQTSWGFTTRSIGSLIMIHGDDKGLVLPPKCAPIQCVIIPIIKKSDKNQAEIVAKAHEIAKGLKAAGVRVNVDDRDNYNPGWKYNHWEIKGVCLRVEIGAMDLEKAQVVMVRRDSKEKASLPWEGLSTKVVDTLAQI
jgi:prolyl-tRNA synthetase